MTSIQCYSPFGVLADDALGLSSSVVGVNDMNAATIATAVNVQITVVLALDVVLL